MSSKAKYTQKIDTRVTEFVETTILDYAAKEQRNKCEMIRILLNEAIGERMLREEQPDMEGQ